jgi:hypothetical protein
MNRAGLETLPIVAGTGATRRSSSVPLTPQASIIAHRFHHPEIIVVDMASVVGPGSYSCPNTPRKPDQPHKWDLWGWRGE